VICIYPLLGNGVFSLMGCNMHGRGDDTQFRSETAKEIDHLIDLGEDGRIIVRCFIRKWKTQIIFN
jgi:hypothetical protein